MESLRFLDHQTAESIRSDFGSPVFVYHEASLLSQAKAALAFPKACELTVRYAMKACPNITILRIFDQAGLHLDASAPVGRHCGRNVDGSVAGRDLHIHRIDGQRVAQGNQVRALLGRLNTGYPSCS